MKFQTAAVIVPNSEFLKGEIDLSKDISKITRCIEELGYDLKKVSVLAENQRSLSCELNLFTKLYDIVIIFFNGRTQCVSEALANITSQELDKFEELKVGECELTNSPWPKSTKVLKSNDNECSIIYLQRIFVITFKALERKLNLILKGYLRQYINDSMYSKLFYLTLNGWKEQIELIRNEKLSIAFGKSVANQSNQDLLTLTAKDFETVVNGEVILRKVMGKHIISSTWIDYMNEMIYQSQEKNVKTAIQVIEKCLADYGVDNVFLSFNGGKDCTVLLHLVQTVMQKKYPDRNDKRKLFCLYVRSDNAFKEQDLFIEQCTIYYNLEIMTVTGNIKDALKITLNKKPHLKACFMGTRRTDPFCANLNIFQMTDPDWPQLMRCSPFLDWHYSDIWDYLLYYKVPYCKLYDYGYTSLGNAINTIRNPSLLHSEGGKEIYLPAYKMLNETEERSGRNKSKI